MASQVNLLAANIWLVNVRFFALVAKKQHLENINRFTSP